MFNPDLVNQFLALATIFAQVGIFLVVLALVSGKYFLPNKLLAVLTKTALPLSFLATIASVAGSLYYSNFLGYAPCELCWWQRVFMYPQAIILGLGLITGDRKVANYCLPLCLIGTLIAAYQTVLQATVISGVPCTSSGVSCSKIFVLQFGYITIPVMSLTAFLLITVLLMVVRSKTAIKD